MDEKIQKSELSALIEWLKDHVHTDKEIVECWEYICKSRKNGRLTV